VIARHFAGHGPQLPRRVIGQCCLDTGAKKKTGPQGAWEPAFQVATVARSALRGEEAERSLLPEGNHLPSERRTPALNWCADTIAATAPRFCAIARQWQLFERSEGGKVRAVAAVDLRAVARPRGRRIVSHGPVGRRIVESLTQMRLREHPAQERQ